MKLFSKLLHHRSLTVSVVALFFGLWALASIPHLATDSIVWLRQSGFVAAVGLGYCTLNLIILLKDNRSGYESFRLSLATSLWALACFPILSLVVGVVSTLFKHFA